MLTGKIIKLFFIDFDYYADDDNKSNFYRQITIDTNVYMMSSFSYLFLIITLFSERKILIKIFDFFFLNIITFFIFLNEIIQWNNILLIFFFVIKK